MNILVHPTLLEKRHCLRLLCKQTGTIDVVGKHAVRLVSNKKTKVITPQQYNTRIILECDCCGYKSNMLMRGEKCPRCNPGKMFDPWPTGGNAA